MKKKTHKKRIRNLYLGKVALKRTESAWISPGNLREEVVFREVVFEGDVFVLVLEAEEDLYQPLVADLRPRNPQSSSDLSRQTSGSSWFTIWRVIRFSREF